MTRSTWSSKVRGSRSSVDTLGSEPSGRFGDAGDTLVEVLLALMVLGLASVALIIAFSTSISASATHRRLASAQIVLSSTSEQVVAGVTSNLTLFQACPNWSTYNSVVPLTIPTSARANVASATISAVAYWSSITSSFQSTCIAKAPQQITVKVTDVNGNTYTNSFVVNYPLSSSNNSTNSGVATQLAFLAQPAPLPFLNQSGVAFPTQPVVQVEDALGNVVTTDLSPVILAIYPANSSVALSGCVGNNLNGVVTFSGCTISTAGVYTIQATDGTLTPAVTGSFTVSGSPDYLKFTTQPKAGVSGGSFSPQPAIAVYKGTSIDTSWNGVLNLTTSGGILSSNCTAAITVRNGVAVMPTCTFQGAYFYDPVSGKNLSVPYTMTATATNVISATSSTFQVTGPGPTSQMVFTTQPTGVAGTSATSPWPSFTVTYEDAFGNVSASTGVPSLALNGGGSLQNCSSSTSGGSVTFSHCNGTQYSPVNGPGFTITASGKSASSQNISVTSNSFNITGVATSLKFTVQPVAGVSGAALPTEPQITVYDAGGRVVTSSTDPITLTASGGDLSHCSGLYPVNGVINVGTCTFAGLIGTQYTMTATQVTANGTLTAVSAPFSPTDAGVPTQVAYTTMPIAGAAGSVLTTQPVVKIEDSAGNVVTSSYVSITLTASGSGTFTLASCSNLNAVSGVVNVTGCTFGGTVGSPYTLTAASPGLTSATAVISPSAAGPITQLVASSGSNQTATVTTAFAAPLVATASDFWNNPVPGASVTFTPPVSTATATFSGGSSTVLTDLNGVATSGTFTANQKAGTYNITATAGSLSTTFSETNTAQRTNDVMTVVQGTPQSTTVGTNFGIGLQVQVNDQYGNPVSNMPVNFAGPTTGASATFAACTSNLNANSCTIATDSNGLGSASVATANHTVGVYAVTATASGVVTPANFQLTNVVGAAAEVLITPNPTSNSASASTNIQLGLQLADQYGNPTTSTGNTVLNFTTSSGAGYFNSAMNAAPGSASVTFANGVGTGTIYYGDTKASAATTIYASNGGSQWGTTTVAITPGAAYRISATAGGGQLGQAGLNFPAAVVATVFDQWSNPVPGANVTFSAPSTGASVNFGGSTTSVVSTDSSGQASAVITANHVVGGPYLVTATASIGSVTFSETNAAGTPASITIVSGSGQSTHVNTQFTTALKVKVTDAWGNAVQGAVVTFSPPSGSSASVTFANGVATATTDATGQATSNFMTANSASGTFQINASTSGISLVSPFVETNLANAPTKVLIYPVPNPTTASASATNNVTLTIQLADQYNNPTTSSTSTSLTLTPSSSKGYLSLTSGAPAPSTLGQALAITIPANTSSVTVYYGDERSGTPTIRTTFNGSTWSSASGVITITGGSAHTIQITSGAGQSASTGAQFASPLVAKITDTWGNTVPAGVNVTFTAPASGASTTFAPSTIVATDTNGNASLTITANGSSGTYNIGVATTGASSQNASETNNTAAPAAVVLSPNPTNFNATNGNQYTTTLNFQLTDANGNQVVNTTGSTIWLYMIASNNQPGQNGWGKTKAYFNDGNQTWYTVISFAPKAGTATASITDSTSESVYLAAYDGNLNPWVPNGSTWSGILNVNAQ